eukprot:39232-Pyramimonas_sp.AAC.3
MPLRAMTLMPDFMVDSAGQKHPSFASLRETPKALPPDALAADARTATSGACQERASATKVAG